ncbi:hypothetical protein LY78DRAFT_685462 [Colletotrichum sublineola]|nr:hypothetical protein LY78DRAFT_685462 [Colletotrichum sublineola]
MPTLNWPAWLAAELSLQTLKLTITLPRNTERDVSQRFKTAAVALGFENQAGMFLSPGRSMFLKTASAKTIDRLVNAIRSAKFSGLGTRFQPPFRPPCTIAAALVPTHPSPPPKTSSRPPRVGS